MSLAYLYTMNKLLENQQAVILRNVTSADQWGANPGEGWQVLATVPCLMWWDHESARGPARLYATPQREIALSEGGMLFPVGTDITEADRIQQITDTDGNVLVYGPFDVIGVFTDTPQGFGLQPVMCTEIAWKRATEARLANSQ